MLRERLVRRVVYTEYIYSVHCNNCWHNLLAFNNNAMTKIMEGA